MCSSPQEADTDENEGSLAFEEFCAFYKMMSTRRDLYILMLSYSHQREYMDLRDLQRFLEAEQKVRDSTGSFSSTSPSLHSLMALLALAVLTSHFTL